MAIKISKITLKFGFLNIILLFHTTFQPNIKQVAFYLTLSLRWAETWCETNKELLKNQPHAPVSNTAQEGHRLTHSLTCNHKPFSSAAAVWFGSDTVLHGVHGASFWGHCECPIPVESM